MIPAALTGIFVIRPLTGWIALHQTPLTNRGKIVISFFGIRGIGSLFYLFYALYITDFEKQNEVLALVMLIIIFSVFIHGIMAIPAIAWLSPNENKK